MLNAAEQALAAANAKKNSKSKEFAVQKLKEKVAAKVRGLSDAMAKMESAKVKTDAAVAMAAA